MTKPEFSALLAEESGKVGGQPLRVVVILDEMDAATRDQVVAALEDPTVKASAIARALGRSGYECSENAVRKWRYRHGL